jgi:phosphatidylglycerophosphate synthase
MLGKYLRRAEKRIFNNLAVSRYIKISPNLISLISPLPALFSVYFLMEKRYLFALPLICLSIILDLLDGAIARSSRKITKFGAYLDPMMDKFTEFFIYLGIFLAGYRLESFLAFAGILMIGSAKSWAFMVIPVGNFDWPAIGERAERYLILFISFILGSLSVTLYGFDALQIGLWIIIILVFTGTVQRILFAKKLIGD